MVRLGHTRQHGSRRRVVQKCARWLAQHADHAFARLALDVLARVEGGGEPPRRAEAAGLLGVRPEGEHLAQAMDAV